MLTYGGLTLTLDRTGELVAFIEGNISLSEIVEWARLSWPTASNVSWPWPGMQDHDEYIRLGRLRWPVGATRWAHFHFLVDDATLLALRAKVYGQKGTSYNALPLILNDGTTTVTTSMFMLPPRPLATGTSNREMWLLTLVDARYFWWEVTASISVTGGSTSWATLLGSIGTALGITITPDVIASAYVNPGEDLVSNYQFLPQLLDAVCANIGHRFVRKLDGTCVTQAPRTAIKSQLTQWQTYPREAGGRFKYTITEPTNDLQALAPSQVTVVFPSTADGTAYPLTTTLASLALVEYGKIVGHTGTKEFNSTAGANIVASVATNLTELTALAKQIATDYYLWRLNKLDVVYCGTVPWTPEGMGDILWDYTPGGSSTRILGRPFNDLVNTLSQWGSFGQGPTIVNFPVVYAQPTTFLDNVFIEGSVLPGVSGSDITTLKTNLTDTEIKVLANLNGCQTQAFLTLTNVQQQLITSNLSVVQTGNLFASITTANASIIPTLLTGFTTAQLTTFANDFSSNIFITTGATPAQMISLLTTITNTQANTLTAAITQQQIGNLLVSMTAANISNLITNLTSTQWTAISVGFSPAQLEAATVNLTTIESLSAAQITSLAQYTPAQISALLTNLTAAQLQAFLTNANAKMDLTTIFNGQTSTSTNAAQNNVTAVNLLYLAYNPTGSSATITGFVPTSPQLPQIITVTNTNSTNSLVLVNASGSSTYPIKVPGGANYSLKPLTSVQLAFDPTTASWIAITAPEASTGSTGGLVKTTAYTSGGSPYTWTPQADTAIIVVEVIGDGGGGAGGKGSAILAGCGAGGGAGGYARSTILAATYGASQTVTVGSGGAGGTASTGVGGTGSSFGSLVTATGGGGGNQADVSLGLSIGGAGGTGSGDISGAGGNGAPGIVLTAVIASSGSGGSCGAFGGGGLGTTAAGNGAAGTGYGSGGAGGLALSAVTNNGGAGAPGLVIVYEYTLG